MNLVTSSEHAIALWSEKISEPGFEIFDSIFASAACQQIIDALPIHAKSGRRAGRRHLLSEPAIMDLATDGRLLGIAKRFVGQTAMPFRATLFEKSGRANWLVMWHQDTALPLTQRSDSRNWGPWSVKDGVNYAHAPACVLEKIVALRLHLDPSTESNGPLRIIPGSHLTGVLNDDEVHSFAHQKAATACLVAQGGILAMRPLLIHASSKALTDQPRRVLHIEYADRLDIGDGIELAQV